ncbi:uncharacterized protein LOC128236014 isoform X2 [Mya arenaria]|uniref:uncharacterized protein LOC128236014 isoform X2 n=1 Tax=Mya arenaria TaxID=6604 RepID=UPI0022E584E2|nr:uncharacterized protein LOC128236014 isoform X2 [Mya arenaria]
MDTLLFTLNLCVLLVVAVYAHGTRNVAIVKTASMSSNHREDKWLAQTAVDGDVGNNSMLSDTCFHTTKEYQPWWRVDLHQDYYITSVVVYNRLDCCENQARNIKLTIGKSLDSMSQTGHLDGEFTTTHTLTVDPPLVGRFVQLQLKGITEFFHLCEVEVMAYPSGTYNVAFGKTASQSSNYNTSKYNATTAVDGNVGDNAFASDSCFCTAKEYQPWWRVDLHRNYYITSVVMHYQLDCCANQARNIKLTIGKSLDSMSQAGYLDGGFTTHTFTIDPPLVGRFVQLQLKGITEFFHLCEVEVMAYPSEFPLNTTVISGIFGGFCAMVILGATGILLTRKYSKGCFSKADEKSEETSRNPDAPVDTVPSARDSEIYTEIETSDCQAKRTGETSFTVQTTDPSQYEELRASVSNTYTKLDRTMNENICK